MKSEEVARGGDWMRKALCLAVFALGVVCGIAGIAQADLETDRAEGIAWLLQNQNGNGSWGAEGGSVAATAEALAGLRNAGADKGFIYLRALSWLANARTDSVDSLA